MQAEHVTDMMAKPHALIVGGTGILRGMVDRLIGAQWQVSLISRRASTFAHGQSGVTGHDCDYHQTEAFAGAIDNARSACGPIALAVGWFHTLKIDAPRRLAEAVGAQAIPGRFFLVLGSAVADPAAPHRLKLAAAVATGLPNCGLRTVVLGFEIMGRGSRWLSDDEISNGVWNAIASDRSLTVGTTEPWEMRL